MRWWEVAAFLVLLIGLTGQNPNTIADAPVVHHRTHSGAGRTATAIVELRMPRRGRRRDMDVPLPALPTWVEHNAVSRALLAAARCHFGHCDATR